MGLFKNARNVWVWPTERGVGRGIFPSPIHPVRACSVIFVPNAVRQYEIHFYASLLEDHSRFRPNEHFHWNERVAWLSMDDDLPKR